MNKINGYLLQFRFRPLLCRFVCIVNGMEVNDRVYYRAIEQNRIILIQREKALIKKNKREDRVKALNEKLYGVGKRLAYIVVEDDDVTDGGAINYDYLKRFDEASYLKRFDIDYANGVYFNLGD